MCADNCGKQKQRTHATTPSKVSSMVCSCTICRREEIIFFWEIATPSHTYARTHIFISHLVSLFALESIQCNFEYHIGMENTVWRHIANHSFYTCSKTAIYFCAYRCAYFTVYRYECSRMYRQCADTNWIGWIHYMHALALSFILFFKFTYYPSEIKC